MRFIIKDADEKQRQLVHELKDVGKAKIPVEKRKFLNNVRLLPNAGDKTLNSFKNKIFPIKI